MARLNLKSQGRCIFCGGAGLCKGHVWPDWLKKVMPPESDDYHHNQIKDQFVTIQSPRGKTPSAKTRQGHVRSRKVRVTCARCDNGWMSKVEEAAKPIVSPMLLGEPTKLTPLQQRIMARWLCLNTIMVEYLSGNISISPEMKKWTMENEEPHPLFRVFIGQYTGPHPGKDWCRHIALNLSLTPLKSGDRSDCNSQSTTLVIGKLCTHVLHTPFSADVPRSVGTKLHQIWQTAEQDIRWPGLSNLGWADVVSLAEAQAAGGIRTDL